jgi:RNA polymerase sigma factor (sigma-70 family)
MIRATTQRSFQRLFESGTAIGLSDAELLDRVRSGPDGRASLEALVLRHGPMVLRICRDVLGDEHEAEDAFQATFLVMVRKGTGVRVGGSLGPWLHGVASRVARHARSDVARRQRREGGTLADRPSGGPHAEHFAERAEEHAALHRELAGLPEVFRTPIVLFHLQGLTHEQVARQLRCPVGTVRSRLARGRERLRDRLARRGVGPAAPVFSALDRIALSPSLPGKLVAATTAAAYRFATGAATSAVVSTSVLSLTKGTLMTMGFFQGKVMALGLVSIGVVSIGATALLARQDTPRPTEKAAVSQFVPVPDLPAPKRDARTEEVAGLKWFLDYGEAYREAVGQKKPLLVYFTSINSANCRLMETRTFPDAAVQSLLGQFVLARLSTDVVRGLEGEAASQVAEFNLELELKLTGKQTTPLFVGDPFDGGAQLVREGHLGPQDSATFLREILERPQQVRTQREKAIAAAREALAFSERMFSKGYVPESRVRQDRENLNKLEQVTAPAPQPNAPEVPVSEVAAVQSSAAELKVRLEVARDRLSHVEDLFKKGVVGNSEVRATRAETRLLEAQVAAQIERLRDEVEILEVQREVREAELMMAEARRASEQATLDRIARIAKANAAVVSAEEQEKARASVQASQAEVQIRRASMKEVAVRIQQLQRKLRALEEIAKDKPDQPRL